MQRAAFDKLTNQDHCVPSHSVHRCTALMIAALVDLLALRILADAGDFAQCSQIDAALLQDC